MILFTFQKSNHSSLCHFYIFQKQDVEKTSEKESSSEGRSLPPGLLPILPEMATRNVITTPAVAPPAKPLQNIAQPVSIS